MQDKSTKYRKINGEFPKFSKIQEIQEIQDVWEPWSCQKNRNYPPMLMFCKCIWNPGS